MQTLKVQFALVCGCQNEVQHHLVSISPNVTEKKKQFAKGFYSKRSNRKFLSCRHKNKAGTCNPAGPLIVFTPHALSPSMPPRLNPRSVFSSPCDLAAVAPSGPCCWRRILLSEVVSDRSHGGQVTELRFLSRPCQSPGRNTQLVSPPTTQEVEIVAKPKILLLLVGKVFWADERDNKSLHGNKTIASYRKGVFQVALFHEFISLQYFSVQYSYCLVH